MDSCTHFLYKHMDVACGYHCFYASILKSKMSDIVFPLWVSLRLQICINLNILTFECYAMFESGKAVWGDQWNQILVQQWFT